MQSTENNSPRAKANPLVAVAVYGLSILMLKGFSLLTIPLYASYLNPAEFGRLDIAVSLIEFTGLCAALGLADTLYRFAASGDSDQRRLAQAEIFGSGLLGASIIMVIAQLLASSIHASFNMTIGVWPLRAGLFAAAITGLIEMPLAWMRLNDRAFVYLSFITIRTLAQIGISWFLLASNYGAASILYASLAVNIASTSVFATLASRAGGIRLTKTGTRNMANYGLPLVGGGLAMYALGTFDRLFLAQAVTAQDIGHYAIAAKLGLATALFIQPLALYWFPKRIAVLDEPDGVARNAAVWGIGFSILITGATFTTLIMPLFVRFGLPHAYAGALSYLPWLILASVMNELVSLSSAGAYKRQAGYEILGVNSVAATVALVGYVALIPYFGVAGAILATLSAHGVRLSIFILRSRAVAPVPLISLPSMAVAISGIVPVLFDAHGVSPVVQAGYVVAGPLLVLSTAILTGMIRLPHRPHLARGKA